MSLKPNFTAKAEAACIKFSGVDLKGQPKAYTLKVKTKEMASALVEALTKEVEAMKK
jgi:hypothetical protein